MSFEAAAWAIKQRTDHPVEKLVLIALADCFNKHNSRCDPSVIYLARAAICSENYVTTAVKSLERQGLIKAHRENGKRTRYIIIMTPPLSDDDPHTQLGATPPLSVESPPLSCGKPVVTNKLTSNKPWEPDEKALILCKMSGVEITEEMVLSFEVKMVDWDAKGWKPNLNQKFVTHCKGIQNGIGNNNHQSTEQQLNDTSWAKT